MSFIGKAIGKLTGASDQADAAKQASETQAQSAQLGIDEQRRQFDTLRGLQEPYVNAGTSALAGINDINGLNGQPAQQNAISNIESSPLYRSLFQQGENSILQNASATGGLRGGNVQAALAQFRPAILSQLISEQYARLAGVTSLGQNAAAGVGNAGLTTGANVANLLAQQGAARAGGQIAEGSVAAQGFGTLANGLSAAYSAGAFGGGSPTGGGYFAGLKPAPGKF